LQHGEELNLGELAGSLATTTSHKSRERRSMRGVGEEEEVVEEQI